MTQLRIVLFSGLLAMAATASFADEAPDAAPEAEPAAEPQDDAAGPTTYTLDPSKSLLYVMIFNDNNRWTPVTGHDHAIRAMDFTGSVTWDTEDLSSCTVAIQFPVTALAVDPPGLRELTGLPADGAISDGQKKTVINNMRGRSQLDQSRFPQISYKSTSCEANGDFVNVTGTLSIHGVGKAVTVPMTIEADENSFSANGAFTLNHADFGMKPFTYGPMTPRNAEPLTFKVKVVGTPSP